MEANNEAEHTQVAASWLAEQVKEASSQGIASTVNRLIKEGAIAGGSQLPTVRALAVRLAVSPATVSAAWNLLRKQRIIQGTGRQGTWVLESPAHLSPTRYDNVQPFWRAGVLDMTLAGPDPELLPDVRHAFASAKLDTRINEYDRPRITPELQLSAEKTWPWAPESWMAVNGGYEGILLLLSSLVVPGDFVAVSDPSTPRILDILEFVGARPLPVSMDNDGPLPEQLEQALKSHPVAFVYEPTGSSRGGVAVTKARRDELGKVLGGVSVTIVEDDGLGELSSAPYCGLGSMFPEKTVMVRSYSKSHGPDLRLAILGGCEEAIARARDYRQYGSGWTSRHLQNALAWMLSDSATLAEVQRAKSVYAARRENMIHLMAKREVACESKDGLSIEVPVNNEQEALLVLASHGIAALGGSHGSIRSYSPWVRLVTSLELDDPEEIAEAYFRAANAF